MAGPARHGKWKWESGYAYLKNGYATSKYQIKPQKFSNHKKTRTPNPKPYKLTLGGSWGMLGRSWRDLGGFWGALGGPWGNLGGYWGDVGGSWEDLGGILGGSWGMLGGSWRDLGGVLGGSWGTLGLILGGSWGAFSIPHSPERSAPKALGPWVHRPSGTRVILKSLGRGRGKRNKK